MATITDPLDRFRYLVARSSNWRAWCGITAGTENEKLLAAYARTVARVFSPDEFAARPVIEVGGTKNEGGTRVAEGGGAFRRRFRIRVAFYDDFTMATPRVLSTERTAIGTFEGQVDLVIDDILAISGSSDNLRIDDYEEAEEVQHFGPSSGEQYIFKSYDFFGRVEGSESV